MAIISNGTTVASGGSVRGSASNLSNIPSPSNSQILSGVASASAGAVGSYALLRAESPAYRNAGNTVSNFKWTNLSGNTLNDSGPSGTWRIMGVHMNNNPTGANSSTVSVRIS